MHDKQKRAAAAMRQPSFSSLIYSAFPYNRNTYYFSNFLLANLSDFP